MDPALLVTLVVLALVDSTSIGTLVIPVLLMLSSTRPNAGRIVAYLGAIAGFYLVAGLVLALAGHAALDALGGVADAPVVRNLQLALGVALFAFSWRFDSKKRRARGKPDRVAVWRRTLEQPGSLRRLLGLAFTAGALEIVTMLPYLAAIGLLASADPAPALYLPILAGYCVVMVAPALGLLGLRLLAAGRIDPVLRRIEAFFERHGESALGWTMGIAGFLIARDAAAHLAWIDIGT